MRKEQATWEWGSFEWFRVPVPEMAWARLQENKRAPPLHASLAHRISLPEGY